VEVWEKINYILVEKKISKKQFVDYLINLEPKLKATGEIPSLQTIYRYLSGKRELKIELIPYIAEVLGISEQELFSSELEYSYGYNVRYSKDAREILDLLPYAPHDTIAHIKNSLKKFKDLHNNEILHI